MKKKQLFTFCILLLHSLFLSNFLFAQESSMNLVIDPQGHSGMVRKVIFTAENKKIVSVSEDKTIRIWDVKSNTLLKTLWGQHRKGKEGRYNALALSPDNRLMAVGGYLPNNEIRIINLNTGKQIASLIGHENIVSDLKFSADGMWLGSSSADQSVRIWYIPTLKNEVFEEEPFEKLLIPEHTDIVYNIDFSSDGTRLVTCSFDGTVRLYSMAVSMSNARIVKVWETTERFTNVDISSDNKYVVAGQSKGKVYIWNTNGSEITTLNDTKGFISSLAFSDDDRKLMITDSKGDLFLYDTDVWLKSRDTGISEGSFSTASFANGSSNYCVTSSGNDGVIKIWDLKTGQTIREFQGVGLPNQRIGVQEGLSVALSISEKTRQPYNKVFNFDSLDMVLSVDNQQGFSMPVIKNESLSLIKKSDYILQAGLTTIKNDKNRDKSIEVYCIGINNDIIIGSGVSLKRYNSEGVLLKEYITTSSSKNAVNVSKDGRFLISSSANQITELWNYETGELLASLFVSTTNDWVCWSPKGYYQASAGGEKYIGWLKNNGIGQLATFYKVSFARDTYHKPEILKSIIANGTIEGLFEEQNEEVFDDIIYEQPVVEWISPTMNLFLDTAHVVNVMANITSKTPLDVLKILVNGRPAYISPKENLKTESDGFLYVIDEQVKITSQTANIQIFAANSSSNFTSDTRSVSLGRERKKSKMDLDFDLDEMFNSVENQRSLKPNIYLLSIGVSEYKDNTLNLTYADKDAIAVSDLYQKQQEGEVFNKVNVKQLTNDKAVKGEILSGFEWLAKNARSNDLAIVFIASHGLNKNNNFYIIPHDVDLNNVNETAVSWSDCSQLMATLPSQVLLYVDACNSGQLGSDISHSDNTESIRKLSSDENGVVVMSASTGKESSLESPVWGHGAFTSAILEGVLEGKADYSGDNVITLRELDLFVATKVEQLTKGKQHPTTQKPSTISTMTVGEKVMK